MKAILVNNEVMFALGAIVLLTMLVAIRVFGVRREQKAKLILAKLLTAKSKIRRHRKYIFITETEPSKSSADLAQYLKTFEEILGVRLAGLEYIQRSWFARVIFFRKNGVRLLLDNTPATASLKNAHRLTGDEVYFGESAAGPIKESLSLIHSGYVVAPPGRGKTIFFRLLALGFLKNHRNAKVIILDAKNSFSHLKSNPDVFLYDMRIGAEIEAANRHFQEIRRLSIESERLLEAQGLQPENMSEVRCKFPELLPLNPTLIICDEAFYYTSLRKGEALFQQKRELIDGLEDFVRRGRSYGIHLFFGLQDGHAEQFFIPRDYFNARLYSRASSDMSRKLTGTDILTSERLKERGVFYLDLVSGRDGGFAGFIRVPLVSSEVRQL